MTKRDDTCPVCGPECNGDCMELPEGKTCNDCRHYRFCDDFIGLEGSETRCDWAPARFLEKVARSRAEHNITLSLSCTFATSQNGGDER